MLEEWDSFVRMSHQARLRLLRMHYESGVGHVGGNLSCLDILLTLHHRVMQPPDRFILSKGHSAGALYVTLWTLGRISEDELKSFHRDNTRLSGHPPPSAIPEILFATGSLGHGLSLAAGLALAKKLRREAGRVYCLLSDGEWNEGFTWESLIFAKHHRLENLTMIVDLNGLQGFGLTREVADLEPLAEKFQTFGLHTREIDGHDCEELREALAEHPAGPNVVVARTRKGRGVSFMENRMEWHYLPMGEDLYRQAIEELEQACAMSFANRS